MRPNTLLIASVATLLLAGISQASTGSAFYKPDATYESFRHDQVTCERAATSSQFRHDDWKPSNSGHTSAAADLVIVRSERGFVQCMTDKGYRLDPNGFSTGHRRSVASR